MKREVKFRVWAPSGLWKDGKKVGEYKDKDEVEWSCAKGSDEMIYPDDRHYCILLDGSLGGLEGGWDLNHSVSDGVLMQYTGLKDKNGKEIYEGDIIKCFDGINRHVVYGEFSSDSGYYSHIGFYLAEAEEMYIANENAFIIGNIYENPELLELNK